VPKNADFLNANSSNYGNIFVILKPFHQRRDSSLTGEAIADRIRTRLQREVPEARVLVFGPPAVRGLGNAGGFKLMVEARGDVNFDALQTRADNLAAQGNQQPGLVGLFNGYPRPYAPALRGHRPDQGQDDGGGAHRRLRRAAGLPGQLLRQRLQPLRSHLASQRPGRRPLPPGHGNRRAA